jgi:hypothetical protein
MQLILLKKIEKNLYDTSKLVFYVINFNWLIYFIENEY